MEEEYIIECSECGVTYYLDTNEYCPVCGHFEESNIGDDYISYE